MSIPINFHDTLISTWRTNNRVTIYLIGSLPDQVWSAKVPGAPRRTVRMIAGHVHNTRCMWLKMLGEASQTAVPESVDRYRVTCKELLPALNQSSDAIVDLLEAGWQNGGVLQGAPYQNFPPDVVHLVAYFTAHEAHHRGQIVMLARALGHRLPKEVTVGLWQWTKRERE